MPQSIHALETPAPLVELARLERNLDRMAQYARDHALALRPHIKTHKSSWLAGEQLARGAVGVTCATTREAEVMSTVADDVLLAYPPVGDAKLARLLALPDHVRLTVALDSLAALEALALAAARARRSLGVYVEADLGMHRVGVQSPADAVALARRAATDRWLEYAGITFYPGHIREPASEQDASLAALRARVAELREALAAAGLPPTVVSGGSTPTAWRTHEIAGVTEFRPGTYVYNDRTTAAIGACEWDECAFTILATVVSTAVPGQAVIDAGTKSLGREPVRGAPGEGFGALLDQPDVVVKAMSEEHGLLDLTRTAWRPRVGDRVRVVPNHVCIAVHLTDLVYAFRDEVVERVIEVEARGR